MAKETDKQMTFEDALNILKGDVYTCPQSDIDEAIRIYENMNKSKIERLVRIAKSDAFEPSEKRLWNILTKGVQNG